MNLDARKRDLKHQIATAETAGDDDTVKRLQGELDTVNKKIRDGQAREAAGAKRRETAQGDGEARTRAPQGRTATPLAKTATGGASGGSAASTSSGAKDTAKTGDGSAAKGK